MPELRRKADAKARPEWDSGVTARMVNGSYGVIDVLQEVLATLASFYPPGHFERENAADYISEVISTRFAWHRYHREPFGRGQNGTMVNVLVGGDVIDDVATMVEDMVGSLASGHLTADEFKNWKTKWRDAVRQTSVPPHVNVTCYDGDEAVLFVHNVGGDADFVAEAQIKEVDQGSIGHPAPYLMRWRDLSTHQVAEHHEFRIPADGRANLLLAEWQSGGDWGKPSLGVIGDRWIVDTYRHDPWETPSPRVIIEVTIRASSLAMALLTRRYSLYIPAKTLQKVIVVEAIP